MSGDLLGVLAPELLLTVTALGALALDMTRPGRAGDIRGLVWLGCLLSLVACLGLMPEVTLQLFPRVDGSLQAPYSFIVDPLALSLKMLVLILTGLTVFLSEGDFPEEKRHAGEYYGLLCFSSLGMLVAISANELLTFFVAFELFSLPLYTLTAIRRYRAESAEAGLKYFMAGSVSSAFLLFGISWIYGSLGTTYLPELASRFGSLTEFPSGLLVGIVLVLVGLGFKISAAPFHMWAPDVYQGGPAPVVAYLSCAPKATVVAFLLRLFWTGFNLQSARFHEDTAGTWMVLLAVLSVLSMFMGNLMALGQRNLKRLLACSGIAQIGYLLAGVAAAGSGGSGSEAAGATVFYLWVYCLTNLAAWSVLLACFPREGSYQRQDLAGLAQRSPGLALALMLALMSLAGVPPLAGFVGKFYLFRAVYLARMPWLVVLGVINSVISLFYYFTVLRTVYFEAPAQSGPVEVPMRLRLNLIVGVAGILTLGLWPGLASWSLATARALLLHP